MPISPVLFLVSAGHFINDIYMGFLAPLYPVIMDRFHLSLSQVGTISMVAAVASGASSGAWGRRQAATVARAWDCRAAVARS